MKKLDNFKKGINLGGWLSQCVNEKEHYDSFISEKDIEIISKNGFDHVRLPFDYELIQNQDGEFIESGFEYFEKCISWCEKYNLNLLIDLHKSAGYSFNNANQITNSLFDSEDLMQRFLRIWDEIARRYGHLNKNVAFELLNEVVEEKYCNDWNKLAGKAIKTIRKNSTHTKIFVGGVLWNSAFSVQYLDLPYDENIVFNFHCYEPLIFTHQKAYWVINMPTDKDIAYPLSAEELITETSVLGIEFRDSLDKILKGSDSVVLFESLFESAIRISNEKNIPLYCGEYGIIDTAPTEYTLNWFKDINNIFEKYGIGRAVWSYKEIDFGLFGEHYAPIFDELLKYL